ncbi:hypothetical protein KOW79_013445 [Hemibagrus wyckioides]|uniref:Uncharacterized protein n=1 Tax=Hemibagrus wyckioides TaxID=337641 RepID=A0A9D3NM39_9TELE|nr:hypothetical protein KOW79_013445 [Hemibagrus wyckioides]
MENISFNAAAYVWRCENVELRSSLLDNTAEKSWELTRFKNKKIPGGTEPERFSARAHRLSDSLQHHDYRGVPVKK